MPFLHFPGLEVWTRIRLMAGGQRIREDSRLLILATSLVALMTAATQAQSPSLPNPAPPADFSSVVGGPGTFAEPTAIVPSNYSGEGSEPMAPRVEMGLIDTINESLFGDVYAKGRWRPLSLGSFFSEGW